jgi:hypothetical protein
MIITKEDEKLYQSVPTGDDEDDDSQNLKNNKKAVKYSNNIADENSLNPFDHHRNKKLKKQRRQDIQKFFNQSENINHNIPNNTSVEDKSNMRNNKIIEKKKKNEKCCKFTFIFDPSGRLSYWMSKHSLLIFC